MFIYCTVSTVLVVGHCRVIFLDVNMPYIFTWLYRTSYDIHIIYLVPSHRIVNPDVMGYDNTYVNIYVGIMVGKYWYARRMYTFVVFVCVCVFFFLCFFIPDHLYYIECCCYVHCVIVVYQVICAYTICYSGDGVYVGRRIYA